MSAALLRVDKVSKRFRRPGRQARGDMVVLDTFSLEVARGEVVALFGPNACGKSTLLNLIAGLERPDEGAIVFPGREASNVRFGYAFQHYAGTLFPWRTLLDNIALKLEINGAGRSERRQNAREFANSFQVDLPWDAYPYQLSGGQKQMVALLRTLVYHPALCLLDEPLSAMDFQNALRIMVCMSRLWHKDETTVVLVSHDIEQAIVLADRVVVLTRPPMRPKIILDVPFPKPREVCILETPEFISLRTQALRAFLEEVSV